MIIYEVIFLGTFTNILPRVIFWGNFFLYKSYPAVNNPFLFHPLELTVSPKHSNFTFKNFLLNLFIFLHFYYPISLV